MKYNVTYLWNVQYYFEPGIMITPTDLPMQIKAASFKEAKAKGEAYLLALGYLDNIQVNGLTMVGRGMLE
jgi:hypothetical protein